ncbi:UV DNA damage repair endonuclease UvsE [bacterium]|nr:UV DNA damage repair endonuclease UvsE [bacterium]
MTNYNLGYACINSELSERPKKQRVTTNRSMIKRTFKEKGLPYASELTLANSKDLLTILKWNKKNNINFFRMSSNLIPWASDYELTELPDYDLIAEALYQAGLYAAENNIRITTHPDHFNKLTSPKESVILNTIRDLEIHGEMFDMMCLPRTHHAKINIHVGAAYGDKPMATGNFCKNFHRLSESVKTRLTVENDDKPSLYTTEELYNDIHKHINIPIVFDYHHHDLHPGEQSEREALGMALSTWPLDVRPVVHYSESRSVEHGDPKIKPQAHSDSYVRAVNTYGLEMDIMLEAKHKEQALFKMRQLMEE